MNKQAILKWAYELILRYEEVAETVIEETSSDIEYSNKMLGEECSELRSEIEELLRKNTNHEIIEKYECPKCKEIIEGKSIKVHC